MKTVDPVTWGKVGLETPVGILNSVTDGFVFTESAGVSAAPFWDSLNL